MREVPVETLEGGRQAAARHAWREAYDLLSGADVEDCLRPDDLEALAEAGWWIGRLDDCIATHERAYAAYVTSDRGRRAALVALKLARDYEDKLAPSIAAGWQHRAERLLEHEDESPEHGHLALVASRVALEHGEAESASHHADRAVDLGLRFGDRDLQAEGVMYQGKALIAVGEVARGLALLDEANAAAVGGELGPMSTANVYCNTISACRDLADYRRAGEWTDTAKHWCERQAIAGFPGICRVYRAEVMRLRGAWAEAEKEARLACDELERFVPKKAAAAFYQLGEIRLRVGDLGGAEEAFRQAHGLGWNPEPGLSLLRLAQGKVDAATSSIRRTLAGQSYRLGRAMLLPAQVEIALAAGDLGTARAATEELASIAEAYGSPALEAGARCARGALELAEGDAVAAEDDLRLGWQLWQEVEAPYEAARVRILLAATLEAQGEDDAAAYERRAALAAFERLGAIADAHRTAVLLAADGEEPSSRGTEQSRVTRTFMFTDIVRSTNLLEALGDEAWEDLLRWHDRTLRSLFAAHTGREIKHEGDGFFIAFDEPTAAIECAVAIQRTLADHRRAQGFAPALRIGLHRAQAIARGLDYSGMGVNATARIANAAESGQIVASRETVPAASFLISEPRFITLRGITDPVEVVSIEWR